MASDAMYLVVYDITDSHERDRVSRILESFGFRIQKSVFECRMTRSGRNRCIQRLRSLDVQSGFIFLYAVNRSVKRVELGKPPDNPFDESNYAYVLM